MLSGLVPIFYTVVQAIVEKLPWVPAPSFGLELSLAIHDAFSRSFLLCNLIPPMVLEHTSPAIRENPWTLLLTALVTAALTAALLLAAQKYGIPGFLPPR